MRGICIIAKERNLNEWRFIEDKPFPEISSECFNTAKQFVPPGCISPEILSWQILGNNCFNDSKGWDQLIKKYNECFIALIDLDIYSSEFVNDHPQSILYIAYLCGITAKAFSIKWKFAAGDQINTMPDNIPVSLFAALGPLQIISKRSELVSFFSQLLKARRYSNEAQESMNKLVNNFGERFGTRNVPIFKNLIMDASEHIARINGFKTIQPEHVRETEQIFARNLDTPLDSLIIPAEIDMIYKTDIDNRIVKPKRKYTKFKTLLKDTPQNIDLHILNITYDKQKNTYGLGQGDLGVFPKQQLP